MTDADTAVEEGIRRTLSRVRSRDAVVGEEHGTSGHSQRRWIVDPIDGTKNFVRGVPVWATLIALAVDDEVVLGVVSAPQLQRRWWARSATAPGPGGRCSRPPRSTSPTSAASRTPPCPTPRSVGWDERGRLDDFLSLSRRCWRTRAYGDFWSYMLLAEGAVDIAAEPELEVYDMAALDVIVREAGGQFTSLDGTPGPFGGNALATNGHLHEAALGFLGSVRGRRRPRRGALRRGLGARIPQPPDARAARRTPARLSRSTDQRPCSGPATPLAFDRSSRRTRRSHAHQRCAPGQAPPGRGHHRPDATVRDLVGMLAEHNVGALIVSVDGTAVDGIVSERDVVRHLLDSDDVLAATVAVDHDRRRCRPVRAPRWSTS